MTEAPPPGDSPPENARLDELLAEVRDAPVPAAEGLTERVVHTARWQRGVRAALLSLSSLTAGIAEGIGRMLGVRHHRQGDRES